MENRKISELNDKSFQSFDDISANLYVPAIINEGNGFENVKVSVKELLRLAGGGSSSGGSSGGSYDSNVIDQMRSSITALQNAVNNLQDASRYPTHKIILQHPTDADDHTEYPLPCGYGAQSKSITVFSEIVGQPKFYTIMRVSFPRVEDGALKVHLMGEINTINGSMTYKGGTIESATVDLWYRDNTGAITQVLSDEPLTVEYSSISPTSSPTKSGIFLNVNEEISNNVTVESTELILKVNGQQVGNKAIQQADGESVVIIEGLVV